MKLRLALRELHRSELKLARALDAVAARHHNDHGTHLVALDLTQLSREHVALIAEAADRYGIRLNARPHTAAVTRQAQQWISDRVSRRPEPSLLLIADLRRLHRLAAGVSLNWELLAQGAEVAQDKRLLELTNRCHPQALRQMRWANAMLKEFSPQALAT